MYEYIKARPYMLNITPLKWFTVLAVIAVLLALGLPPSPDNLQQLHATPTQYRLAISLLLIPYVLIWYASFYAYAKLVEYSQSIRNTKDGSAFVTITQGMGVLSFSLVIPTILTLIITYISAQHPSFETAGVIISNYIGLYPGMIAFFLLCTGGRNLLRTTKNGAAKLDMRVHAIWYLLLSVVFAYLTFQNAQHENSYMLPVWLLISTIIVPYLYGWAVGFLGAYNLSVYATTVKGKIYSRAIKQFAAGILVAIIASVAIQFVNITLAKTFAKSLGAILLTDYLLLAVVATGLVLMALATQKLKLIEEI